MRAARKAEGSSAHRFLGGLRRRLSLLGLAVGLGARLLDGLQGKGKKRKGSVRGGESVCVVEQAWAVTTAPRPPPPCVQSSAVLHSPPAAAPLSPSLNPNPRTCTRSSSSPSLCLALHAPPPLLKP